ncbi:MAG: hypothetical protein JJ959_20255 [Nisaea sp.]|uniref:surface carbohydrate biosynthesis protein n=1 Tax=Nisaea sp. TaxID=2024842 RepID=UPI001B0CC658|nr:surface carbohydrate biosynthesis protein [Nisaea sp.]MBO6562891.1 hypothetical protein [Nisaea sp.]
MYKVLYLPIEESARELEARLILAHRAIEDGWQVIIGNQLLLTTHMGRFPAGVYFAKGTNAIQRNKIKPLKEAGFGVAAIEEENVPLAEPLLIQNLMAGDFAKLTDLYFAHGPFDADIVTRANPAIEGKLEILGVGRFDLLKRNFLHQRRQKAAELRGRYGDFVLLNTNFGYANTFVGSPKEFYDKLLVGMGIVDISNPDEIALWERALEFESRTMEGVKELVRGLAREIPVVLRPHTSERIETWQELEAERDWGGRLSVVREGPIVDWLLASRLVIQNSCTTGLEAKVMGVPVASFTPFDNGMLSCFVANRVLPRIGSVAGVIDAARRVLAGEQLADVLPADDAEPLTNFIRESETELVSDRQWRSIREKFDAGARAYSEAELPQEKLEVKGLHPQARVKFAVSLAQFRDAYVMIARALGGGFPVKVRVLGDGLFALTRGE